MKVIFLTWTITTSVHVIVHFLLYPTSPISEYIFKKGWDWERILDNNIYAALCETVFMLLACIIHLLIK
jgi:hypothetical protein